MTLAEAPRLYSREHDEEAIQFGLCQLMSVAYHSLSVESTIGIISILHVHKLAVAVTLSCSLLGTGSSKVP